MVRASILALQGLLESLRSDDLDYVIVAVGVRGPNADCRNGNAVATVRMGHDEETYEALYLPDAIHMARQRIIQKRAAALRAKAPQHPRSRWLMIAKVMAICLRQPALSSPIKPLRVLPLWASITLSQRI
jgi:hypothetical protein